MLTNLESFVVLETGDAERLLLVIYGKKPARVHTLLCGCGATADLRTSPDAWLGWQVLPHPCCPTCRQGSNYPGAARGRFLELVEKLCGVKEGASNR